MLSLEILHERSYRLVRHSQDIGDVSDPQRPRVQNGRKHVANTVRFNRKAGRLRATDGLAALGMFQAGCSDPIKLVALKPLTL
jgi:hypothetical protein